jgi:hypothetical protein
VCPPSTCDVLISSAMPLSSLATANMNWNTSWTSGGCCPASSAMRSNSGGRSSCTIASKIHPALAWELGIFAGPDGALVARWPPMGVVASASTGGTLRPCHHVTVIRDNVGSATPYVASTAGALHSPELEQLGVGDGQSGPLSALGFLHHRR